ncbi:MAG: hypothetical protein AAF694_22745, partial [Bacteroidota bacterium]
MRKHVLHYLFLGIFFLPYICTQAQRPQQGQGSWNRGNMPKGKMYGKIVDQDGKGVGYASVQLVGMQFDSTTKSMKEVLLAGQLSAGNGDFVLDQVPMRRQYTLKVNIVGFADLEQTVSFRDGEEGGAGGGRPQAGGRPGGGRGNWQAMMAGGLEKDLGNIAISPEDVKLDEVVIEGEA